MRSRKIIVDMNQMKSRLRASRKAAGLTQQEVAIRLGVTRGAVGIWEAPGTETGPTLANLKGLAKIYGVDVEYLAGSRVTNVNSEGVTSVSVPLLRLLELRPNLLNGNMEMYAGEAKFMQCPAPHSSSTIGLLVEGNSMLGAGEGESFPPGTVVYLDPERASECESGEPVLARLECGTYLFRQLVDEPGAKPWLRPLNREYDKTTEPFEVVAKYIGKFVFA